MALRATVTGELLYAGVLLTAALLVPSLALAAGTISGSKKFFEITYLIIWYIGPVDHLPQLDFLATTDLALSPTRIIIGLTLTLLAGSAAIIKRRSQVTV